MVQRLARAVIRLDDRQAVRGTYVNAGTCDQRHGSGLVRVVLSFGEPLANQCEVRFGETDIRVDSMQ